MLFAAISFKCFCSALAQAHREVLSPSFPGGAPCDARHWPFSDTAYVSQTKECPELIPRIRPQIREIALTDPNPQRRALYLSSLLTLGVKRRWAAQGNGRCLDVRHTTNSAFKRIKIGQVAKSRRCSSEPHGLSAAWAKRGLRLRAFIAHGTKRSFSQCPDT